MRRLTLLLTWLCHQAYVYGLHSQTFTVNRHWNPYHSNYVLLYKKQEVGEESAAAESLKIIQQPSTPELNRLLESLPTNEKYSILLQSFGNKVLEGKDRDPGLISKMESLYLEMIKKSIQPDRKGSQALLDAAAVFCDVNVVSKALRLVKAGGVGKVFGVMTGQLTIPHLSRVDSKLLEVEMPSDNREREIMLASTMFAALLGGVALQVSSLARSSRMIGKFMLQVNEDLRPWFTIYESVGLVSAGSDLFLRQAEGIRCAVAGIERLLLRDEQRQAHCDGSAFMSGYLLGLPCFCYKPDVIEALKMLRDSPLALNDYKQRSAIRSNRVSLPFRKETNVGTGLTFDSMLQDLRSNFVLPATRGRNEGEREVDLDTELSVYGALDSAEDKQADLRLKLGRVLVWLMTPAAAEQLKYGKTVMADPRLCQKLFQVLDILAQSSAENKEFNTIAEMDESEKESKRLLELVPKAEEDRYALTEWAFFEARQLVRQYGDLLEDVQSYMNAGTSTVGECAMMIEQELS